MRSAVGKLKFVQSERAAANLRLSTEEWTHDWNDFLTGKRTEETTTSLSSWYVYSTIFSGYTHRHVHTRRSPDIKAAARYSNRLSETSTLETRGVYLVFSSFAFISFVHNIVLGAILGQKHGRAFVEAISIRVAPKSALGWTTVRNLFCTALVPRKRLHSTS